MNENIVRLHEANQRSAHLDAVALEDFYALMPMHSYIFTPNGELWPAASINARIPPVLPAGAGAKDKPVPASTWLDQHRPVEQMTWAPGLPALICDRLISEGGWIEREGCRCFNLYRPPAIEPGNATEADPWLDHARKVFGDDADHILLWLAHRVQRPADGDGRLSHGHLAGAGEGRGWALEFPRGLAAAHARALQWVPEISRFARERSARPRRRQPVPVLRPSEGLHGSAA